jgi:hypothetical protein
MWIVFAGLRDAARRPGSQGQAPKEWQPFTKLVWAVFIFGIPIAIGGGWRVAAFVILGLIFGSAAVVLVCASAHAIVHRDDKPATPADPLAEFFNERKD